MTHSIEIWLDKIGKYVQVDLLVDNGHGNIDLGLHDKGEARDLAEHLLAVAEELLDIIEE